MRRNQTCVVKQPVGKARAKFVRGPSRPLGMSRNVHAPMCTHARILCTYITVQSCRRDDTTTKTMSHSVSKSRVSADPDSDS